MSKKKSIFDSGTTKGSAPRKSNKKKYDENWEKIFGKKKKKEIKIKGLEKFIDCTEFDYAKHL